MPRRFPIDWRGVFVRWPFRLLVCLESGFGLPQAPANVLNDSCGFASTQPKERAAGGTMAVRFPFARSAAGSLKAAARLKVDVGHIKFAWARVLTVLIV